DRYEALVDDRGKKQSSFDGAVVVTYTPEPLDAAPPERHVYAATWQPVRPGPFSLADPARPFSLPAGRYRLRAIGQAASANGLAPYEAVSPAIEIIDAPLARGSSAVRRADGLDVVALLG